MRSSPSLRASHTGPVGAAAISAYRGAVAGLAARLGGTTILDPEAGASAGAAAAKAMRREDGPTGQRALCQGFRTADSGVAASRVERTSDEGVLRWAILLAGQNLILRGGEIGTVDAAEFDPRRDLSWASFQWMEPCAESDGLPWLLVLVVSIKDTTARAQPHRIGIRRRAQGALGHDPLCAYDAIRIHWLRHVERVRPQDRPDRGAGVPFFSVDGVAVNTSYVTSLVRAFATAVGLDPALFGARSLRIGGATDWLEQLGRDTGRAVIRQRGRWASDCDLIYERALLRTHLEGSAAIGAGTGRDLERAMPGWVQPALRH